MQVEESQWDRMTVDEIRSAAPSVTADLGQADLRYSRCCAPRQDYSRIGGAFFWSSTFRFAQRGFGRLFSFVSLVNTTAPGGTLTY